MKFPLLAVGLLSCSTLLTFEPSFTNFASAQCVQADVSVQYNISGSQQPTNRSNDVDMQSNGRCSGNASVTTGVQGNEGGRGPVTQRRVVRHRTEGGSDNGTGVSGPTVPVISNVGVDVYNAADLVNY
jgi:hypothetical protein